MVDATPEDGTVTALIQLQALNDAYLLVVRVVDPQGVWLLPPHQSSGQRI